MTRNLFPDAPSQAAAASDRPDPALKRVIRYFASRIPYSALILLLAGCTVGPNYVKPPVQSPAAWKETGWKAPQPRDHLPRGPWWEVFGDPQLNALEESVNISNQNIAAAIAQFQAAHAMVQAARAAYFPIATAGASATRSRGSPNSAPPSGPPVTNYVASGTAAWEPDLWGRVRRTVESVRANAQASAADLEALRLSSCAELAQDYYQLRELDAVSLLFDETVADYQKFLQLTRYRYASGVASRGDVLLAETQVKTAAAEAVDIGVQRAQLEHAIAVLAGKAPSNFSIPASPLLAPRRPSSPSMDRERSGPARKPSRSASLRLLERRPDVAAAERSAAAANAQIGVAISAFYPDITLSATGGFAGSTLSNWLDWPSRIWTIGAGAAETVYDAGLRRAMTDQARALYDASVASYRQTVLAAFQDVEDNLAAIRILENEALAEDAAVTASVASADFTVNQYKQGIASALDVVVTEATVLANRRAAADILGRRMVACALLLKALGGGWDVSALPSAEALN